MPRKSPVLSLVLSILAYCALWLLIPKATILPIIMGILQSFTSFTGDSVAAGLGLATVVIMAAPTIAFMAAQMSVIYFFTKLKLNVWQALFSLIACLACVALFTMLIAHQMYIAQKLGRYPNIRELFFILGNYFGPLKMPISMLVMLAASSIGYMVSLRIKDKNLILPVVMFAACIDYWTVTQGHVAAVLKHAPEIVSAVSAPIPQAGAGSFVPVTMMGPGDPLFIALVLAAVHRLKMDSKRNFWFIFVAMTLGMVAVMLGYLPFLPALTLLAVAVILANLRQFKLSNEEKISVAVVGVVLFAFTFWVWPALRGQGTLEAHKKPGIAAKAPSSFPAKSSRKL